VENTVAAFLEARTLGADGVELDVHLTSEGEVVVHHDAEVPGLGRISQLKWELLPDWFPSLTEAFDACAPLKVIVEIKQDEPGTASEVDRKLATTVASLLAERADKQRAIVSSFSMAVLDIVREEAPSLATALLVHPTSGAREALAASLEHGHFGLHPFFAFADAALINEAKRLGVGVRAWTVDDPLKIAELADLGVDAVITNDVETARRALKRFHHPSAGFPLYGD
jgi:glycerophosphoryl diester phosphodiesterase